MSTGFSLPQLRESLWARRGARVHAVIDGLAVPGIAGQLKAAEVAGWDCLYRGALSAEVARAAPYLAELRSESPFTDWLLGEAPAAYPGWGVLAVSTLALLPMREHCRNLGEVVVPTGERRRWRWYDPLVLRTILPTLIAGQLDEVFADGMAIVIPEASAWTWFSVRDGVLASETRPLLRAAA
jgi:hypothetical protein